MFSLDILSHRMSAMGIFQQLRMSRDCDEGTRPLNCRCHGHRHRSRVLGRCRNRRRGYRSSDTGVRRCDAHAGRYERSPQIDRRSEFIPIRVLGLGWGCLCVSGSSKRGAIAPRFRDGRYMARSAPQWLSNHDDRCYRPRLGVQPKDAAGFWHWRTRGCRRGGSEYTDCGSLHLGGY